MMKFRTNRRDSLSRPTVRKDYYRDGYTIVLPRVAGERWGKIFDGGNPGMIAAFPTRAAAERFIRDGQLQYWLKESEMRSSPVCHKADPDLFSFFSDYFKDVEGFRPTGDYWTVARVESWIASQRAKDDDAEFDSAFDAAQEDCA